MGMTKHYVKLVRFRIEEAFVEVKAADHQTAEDQALALDLMGEVRWGMRPYDDEVYEPFGELVLSALDLEADHGSVASGKRWLKSEESHDTFQYCFVMADVGNGEGKFVAQPWLEEMGGLWIEDVTGDWIADINRLREVDNEPTDPDGAKVLPFSRRPRGDDEPPPDVA